MARQFEFFECEQQPPADGGIKRDEAVASGQCMFGRHLSGHRREGEVLESAQEGSVRCSQDRADVDTVLRSGFKWMQSHRKNAVSDTAKVDQALQVCVCRRQQIVGRLSDCSGEPSGRIGGGRRVDERSPVSHEHGSKQLLDEALVPRRPQGQSADARGVRPGGCLPERGS